jgi:hypothetical protein
MTFARLASCAANGLAVALIAFAILFVLANVGLIARPSPEYFAVGS